MVEREIGHVENVKLDTLVLDVYCVTPNQTKSTIKENNEIKLLSLIPSIMLKN